MSLASRKRATWLLSLGYWHAAGHSHVVQIKTASRFANVRVKLGVGVYTEVGDRLTRYRRFRSGAWEFSVTLPGRLAARVKCGVFRKPGAGDG